MSIQSTIVVWFACMCLASSSLSQTELVSDNFNGKAQTRLGSNWTGCGYGGGAYNKLVYENGRAGGNGYWTQDCALYTGYGPFPPDQYVTATLVAPSPSATPEASLQLRGNATPNADEAYIACGWDAQDFAADYHYRIWSLAPGAPGPETLWLSDIVPATGDVISCQVVANTVSMSLNGKQLASIVDTSGVNSGYPGLFYIDPNSGPPSEEDVIFSSFHAGTSQPGFGPTVAPIDGSTTVISSGSSPDSSVPANAGGGVANGIGTATASTIDTFLNMGTPLTTTYNAPGKSGINGVVRLATNPATNLWLMYDDPWGIYTGTGTIKQTYSGAGAITTAIELAGLPGGGVDAYPFVLYGCDPWMDCYQGEALQFPKRLSAISSLNIDISYTLSGTITGSDIDVLFDEWVCNSSTPSDSSQCLEVEVLPYYSFVNFGGGRFVKTINQPVILNGTLTTVAVDEYVGGTNVLFYPHDMPGLVSGELQFNLLDLLNEAVAAYGDSSYQYVAGIEVGTEFGASPTQSYTLTINKLGIAHGAPIGTPSTDTGTPISTPGTDNGAPVSTPVVDNGSPISTPVVDSATPVSTPSTGDGNSSTGSGVILQRPH